MKGLRSELKVLVASRPIDFRRGIHGLVATVAQALGADPYSGNVFVFRSKRKDRLKMIVWDGTGMVPMTKWLQEGAFTFPPVQDGTVCSDGDAALGFGGGSPLIEVAPTHHQGRRFGQ